MEPTAAGPAPAASPRFAFRDLRLHVGDRMQLDPPSQTGAARLGITVVGWVEGRSLIVSAPRTAAGRVDLREGEIVLLRAFTGRRAYAFRCSVQKRSAPPFEYLHLSFPDGIEGIDVRNAPRCRVDLPASVTGPAGKCEVRVENISTTGALLMAREPLGAAGEQVRLDWSFELHDVPVSLALECTIRGTRAGEQADGTPFHAHGIAFATPGANDRLVLAALVAFQLSEHPRMAA